MKNVCLIDNSNRMKPQHVNKSKLHLTKNGSRMLGGIFTREICKMLIDIIIGIFQAF